MPEDTQGNEEDMSVDNSDPHTPAEAIDPLFQAILDRQKALVAEGCDVSEAAVDAALDVLSGSGQEVQP